MPGSVLRVAVDPKNPLAHGYGSEADIFFDNSPVWKIDPSAGQRGGRAPSRGSPARTPLRSGWAWGQKYLDKGIQMVEANVGKGRVFVFGNDLLFRTQPHGNYKFFFNGLYLSVARRDEGGDGTVRATSNLELRTSNWVPRFRSSGTGFEGRGLSPKF